MTYFYMVLRFVMSCFHAVNCFFGFHAWHYYSWGVPSNEDPTVREARRCKHCGANESLGKITVRHWE